MTARIHYACYARWTYSATQYAVGTDEGTRSGIVHDPVMMADVDLATRFSGNAVLTGNQMQLVIADGAGGTYRTLVAGNVLDGTQVTVETVCTVTGHDGSTTEQAVTQLLTVQGSKLEPGKVTLTLIDLEDAKLDTLYPTTVYSADLFRDIDGGFAGRAIPYPVGTCRKLPCPQFCADTVSDQWFHAVCEAALTQVTIAGINTGAKTITVAGDYTDRVSAGTIIYCTAASANPGRYTVTGASYSAPNTTITVSETLGSATVSGSIVIPPTVLAVYRDGRLVASTEYTVHLVHPFTGPIDDGDFDGSPASWTATNTGTGTASLTGGRGRVTGDGGTSNYGRLTQSTTTPTTLPGSYALATITVATGTRVRLYSNTISGGTVITSAGTHTVPVLQELTTGYGRVNITNYNTGSASTTEVDDLATSSNLTLLMIRFVREQVDFSGQPYAITADVRGVVSRNVVDEIDRLLYVIGATADSSSFTTARSYATTHEMLVDVDHGADGEVGQRRARAILDDLLLIARGTLSVNSSGHYVLTQDRTASVTDTLVEDEGDLVAVAMFERPAKPASVGIRYAPNPRDPSTLTYVATRAVTGGQLAAESPTDVRYLSNPTAADRLLCYRALRTQYNARLRFRRIGAALTLGQVVTITSAANYVGARSWFIAGVSQVPGGVECEAWEYDAAVHTYSAGTIPTGATVEYQPDYSQTPPAAPTGMAITAGSVATAGDGTMTARVTVKATPPSVNWSELWFAAIHNTTGEIAGNVLAASIGGGEYGTTLTGLRPGEVYKLQSWAVNATNVSGTVQSTFNATAIGGGASVTTFTAPGQTSVPADVSSITVAQGMGRIVNVSWPAVTGAAIWGYTLERYTGGSWSEVWRGQATNYRDTERPIGDVVQYRVKARDTYGNLSANWRTSGSVTIVSNITGGNGTGDIDDNTVDTANRTAASGVSVTFSGVDAATMFIDRGFLAKTVSHSLGKTPMVGGVVVSDSYILGGVSDVTNTTLDIAVMGATDDNTVAAGNQFGATYNETELEDHGHDISVSVVTNGGTATAYIW